MTTFAPTTTPTCAIRGLISAIRSPKPLARPGVGTVDPGQVDDVREPIQSRPSAPPADPGARRPCTASGAGTSTSMNSRSSIGHTRRRSSITLIRQRAGFQWSGFRRHDPQPRRGRDRAGLQLNLRAARGRGQARQSIRTVAGARRCLASKSEVAARRRRRRRPRSGATGARSGPHGDRAGAGGGRGRADRDERRLADRPPRSVRQRHVRRPARRQPRRSARLGVRGRRADRRGPPPEARPRRRASAPAVDRPGRRLLRRLPERRARDGTPGACQRALEGRAQPAALDPGLRRGPAQRPRQREPDARRAYPAAPLRGDRQPRRRGRQPLRRRHVATRPHPRVGRLVGSGCRAGAGHRRRSRSPRAGPGRCGARPSISRCSACCSCC